MRKHKAASDIFSRPLPSKSGVRCWIYKADGKIVEVKPAPTSQHNVDSLDTLMSQPEYKGYKYIKSERGQKIQVGYQARQRRALARVA